MLPENRTKHRRKNNDFPAIRTSSNLPTATLRKRSWEQSLITDIFKPAPPTPRADEEENHPKKAKMAHKTMDLKQTKKRKFTKKLKLKEGIYSSQYRANWPNFDYVAE